MQIVMERSFVTVSIDQKSTNNIDDRKEHKCFLAVTVSLDSVNHCFEKVTLFLSSVKTKASLCSLNQSEAPKMLLEHSD